jgi:hypothetical protein
MGSTAARDLCGETFAIVTQHEKQRALGPVLRERLDAELVVIDDIDTDALGTFTRDIPRTGTQLEAARKKARLALDRGYVCGLGSEGAFIPGPFGIGSYDLEIVVFVDAVQGIEVVGRALEPGLHVHGVVDSPDALWPLARRAGFPEHGLVIRPDDEHHQWTRKGIRTERDLLDAFIDAQQMSREDRVFVETDLRAHQNPTRMVTIGKAAVDLVERLSCRCPACATPGFGLIERVPGRPCRWCGTPTSEPAADELGCVRCPHRERRPVGGEPFADPGRCDRCNP